MDDSGSVFSKTYEQAREFVLQAGARADAEITSYCNVAASAGLPFELATDVVKVGHPEADSALVLVSATHGVEGYCGSAVQTHFLRQYALGKWPEECAIVVVHAINSHGMAHYRRVNEDNVDLNRNFVDFNEPLPKNPGYEQLHSALVPQSWTGAERQATDERLETFIAANGPEAFQVAVASGQYTHPDGMFYGGRGPVWSNRTWQRIIEQHLGSYARVALIDLHTGLGPFGYGEPIFEGAPGSASQARACGWYGDDLTCPDQGTSTSMTVQGTISTALETLLTVAELTLITLEFGTLELDEVFDALRADNWLHVMGEVDSELGRQIKRTSKETFCPSSLEWQAQILERSEFIIRCALNGLNE